VRPPQDFARALRRRVSGSRWPRDVAASVPAVPPGWVAAPPDFVGVGAQKAGTTWWYSLVASHPRVHEAPNRRKELHYFDRFWDQTFGPADARRYQSFFPRPPGDLAGEWTPRYMVDFWTPALLRESAPEAKVLVILRDPFDRFCSGVTHDLQRRAPHHPIVTELGVRKSTYRQQLRRLLNHFDREALLVLQYEQCRSDPRGQLRRTLDFIGLDDFEPPSTLLEYGANVTRGRRYEPEARIRDAFVATLSGDLTRLLADFPEIDPSLWPSCKGLY
jgi:hypothetical protein